jgi:hypothetical protein
MRIFAEKLNVFFAQPQLHVHSSTEKKAPQEAVGLGEETLLKAVGQIFGNRDKLELTTESGKVIDTLSAKSLNQAKPEDRAYVLGQLGDALQARIGASQHQSKRQTVDGKPYVVHNSFAPLQSRYSSKDLDELMVLLTQKGVFKTKTHPVTGLVQTSDTSNAHMLRQWFTDSVMTGLMQRVKDPEGWKRNQVVNATVLNIPAAKQAVQKSVDNPDWYRKGDVKNGVFHIYMPESIQMDAKTNVPILDKIRLDDTWFNQQRLESQALVLSSLVDTLKAGMVPSTKKGTTKLWGFSPDFVNSGEPFTMVKNTIINMARYLKAVNTNPKTGHYDFAAPSASSWEEAPFPGGMTSDSAMTVLAFEKLRDLLHNPDYAKHPGITPLRQALFKAPNGELLRDKAMLDAFIHAGRAKVAERIIQPLQTGQMPMQNPVRKPDTSLTLLAASKYRFHPEHPVQDTQIRLGIIQSMKQMLSGEHGMRRYNEYEQNGTLFHDSYLNKNFNMPTPLREVMAGKKQATQKDYGSGDASSAEALKERQTLSTPQTAAQWSLGETASLQALARAKKDLLKAVQSSRTPITSQQNALLKTINAEMNDSIRKNLGLIVGPMKPGDRLTRANGNVCPPNSVMEAYEVVQDLHGQEKWVPGVHTLPWSAAQLFDGLRKARKAQTLEESLRNQGMLYPGFGGVVE